MQIVRIGRDLRGASSRFTAWMPRSRSFCARRCAGTRPPRSSPICLRVLWAWRPAAAPTTGRVLSDLGHEVRLTSPQFATPYVKSNERDRNDAEAICEAVGRPSMRFVPQKSGDRPALQAAHRIRQRLVSA